MGFIENKERGTDPTYSEGVTDGVVIEQVGVTVLANEWHANGS